MESATQNVKQLQTAGTRQDVPGATGTPHMQGVRKLSHPDQRPSKGANCYRYGKSGHSAARCRFRDAKCHYCGKIEQQRLKEKTEQKATPTCACDSEKDEGKSTFCFTLNQLAVQTP